MSKSHLAVLISMLFAAPAAVVLAQSATTSPATESAQELQTQELQIAASEPMTSDSTLYIVEQTTFYVVPVEISMQEVSVQAEAPAQHHPVEFQPVSLSATFPQGTYSEEWNLNARHTAYVAQSRHSSMMAVSSSFPAGTTGEEAHTAYFNGLEQQRMASSSFRDSIARSEVQSQAGSSELAMSTIR